MLAASRMTFIREIERIIQVGYLIMMFEALIALSLEIAVLWIVTSCGPLGVTTQKKTGRM
jgi:hypothetical protein